MTDEVKTTIDWKRTAVIVGVLSTLIGGGVGAYGEFTTYHEQYATQDSLDASITAVQREILTVAKLNYEDQLVGFDFLEQTGNATELDRVNRANIERRLADLRNKLDRLE